MTDSNNARAALRAALDQQKALGAEFAELNREAQKASAAAAEARDELARLEAEADSQALVAGSDLVSFEQQISAARRRVAAHDRRAHDLAAQYPRAEMQRAADAVDAAAKNVLIEAGAELVEQIETKARELKLLTWQFEILRRHITSDRKGNQERFVQAGAAIAALNARVLEADGVDVRQNWPLGPLMLAWSGFEKALLANPDAQVELPDVSV